ncbi:MAG: nitroreductase [Paenibacillaceae bacterium]|nr:nitroreductase [Paenibacillaceae bacterium]
MTPATPMAAGTIAELIRTRRTVRLFKPDPVPTPLILELLDIAIWAPNHMNRQPWRFILFREDGRKRIAEAMIGTYTVEDRETFGGKKKAYFENVPAHLVVVLKEDPRQKVWDEDYAAVCSLIQNFQLAAWERGLGVFWRTNGYNYDPGFRDAVGVRPGEKIAGLLHIGYPDAIPREQPRTSAAQLTTIVEN